MIRLKVKMTTIIFLILTRMLNLKNRRKLKSRKKPKMEKHQNNLKRNPQKLKRKQNQRYVIK